MAAARWTLLALLCAVCVAGAVADRTLFADYLQPATKPAVLINVATSDTTSAAALDAGAMSIASSDGLLLTTDGSVDIEGGALRSDAGAISLSAAGDGNVSIGGVLDFDAGTSTLSGGSLDLLASMDDVEVRAANLLDIESDGDTEFSGGDVSIRAGNGVITAKSLQQLTASGSSVSFEGMNSFNYRAGSIEAVAAKALDAVGNLVKFTSGGTTSIRSEFNNVLLNAAEQLDVDTSVFVAEGTNGVFVESLQGNIAMNAESDITLEIARDVIVSTEKEILFTSVNGTTTFKAGEALTMQGANGIFLFSTDPAKEFDMIGLDDFNVTSKTFELKVVDGGNLGLESITNKLEFSAQFELALNSDSVSVASTFEDISIIGADDVIFKSNFFKDDLILIEGVNLLFEADNLLHVASGSWDIDLGSESIWAAPHILVRFADVLDIDITDITRIDANDDIILQGGDVYIEAEQFLTHQADVLSIQVTDVDDIGREGVLTFNGETHDYSLEVLEVSAGNVMASADTLRVNTGEKLYLNSGALMQWESFNLTMVVADNATITSQYTTSFEGRDFLDIVALDPKSELLVEARDALIRGDGLKFWAADDVFFTDGVWQATSEELFQMTARNDYIDITADKYVVDGISEVDAADDIRFLNFGDWFWNAHENDILIQSDTLVDIDARDARLVAYSLLLDSEDDMLWDVSDQVLLDAVGNDNIEFDVTNSATWVAGGDVIGRSTGRLTVDTLAGGSATWRADESITFDAAKRAYFYADVDLEVELSAFFTATSDGDFRTVVNRDLFGEFGGTGEIVGESVLFKGGSLTFSNFRGEPLSLTAGTSMYIDAVDEINVEATVADILVEAGDQINAISNGTQTLDSGFDIFMRAEADNLVFSEGAISASSGIDTLVEARDDIRLIGQDVSLLADGNLGVEGGAITAVSAENRFILLEGRDTRDGTVLITSVNDTLVTSNDDIRWEFQANTTLEATEGQMLVRATADNAGVFMFGSGGATVSGFDHVDVQAGDLNRGGHEIFFEVGRDAEFIVEETTPDIPAGGGITVTAGGSGLGIQIRSFVEAGSDVEVVAGPGGNVTIYGAGRVRGETDTGPLTVEARRVASFVAETDDVNFEASGNLGITSAANLTFIANSESAIVESTGGLQLTGADDSVIAQVGTVTNENGIGVEILSDSGHVAVTAETGDMNFVAGGLIDIDAGNDIEFSLAEASGGSLLLTAGTVLSIEGESGIYMNHDLPTDGTALQLTASGSAFVSSSVGNDISIISASDGIDIAALTNTLTVSGVRGVSMESSGDVVSVNGGKMFWQTEGSILVDATGSNVADGIFVTSLEEQRWTALDQITADAAEFNVGEAGGPAVVDIDAGGTPLTSGFVSRSSDAHSFTTENEYDVFAGATMAHTTQEDFVVSAGSTMTITSTGTAGSVSDIVMSSANTVDMFAVTAFAIGSSERVAMRSSVDDLQLFAFDEMLVQTSRELVFNSLGTFRMDAGFGLDARTGETRFSSVSDTTITSDGTLLSRSEAITQLIGSQGMEIDANGGVVSFLTADRDSSMSFLARGPSSEARLISNAVNVATEGPLEVLADDRTSIFTVLDQRYTAGGETTIETSDSLVFSGYREVNITSDASFPGTDILASSADLLQLESTGPMRLRAVNGDAEVVADGTAQFATVSGDIVVDVTLDASFEATRDFRFVAGNDAAFRARELVEFGSTGIQPETNVGTRFAVRETEGVLEANGRGLMDIHGEGGTFWESENSFKMFYQDLLVVAHGDTGIHVLVDGPADAAQVEMRNDIDMLAGDADINVFGPHTDEDSGYFALVAFDDSTLTAETGDVAVAAEQGRVAAYGVDVSFTSGDGFTSFTATGADGRRDAMSVNAAAMDMVSANDVDIEGLNVFIGVDTPYDREELSVVSTRGGALFFSEGNNEHGNGVEIYGSSEADMLFTAGGSVISESGGASFISGSTGVSMEAALDIQIQSNTNISFVGEGQPHSQNERFHVEEEIGVELRTFADTNNIGDDIQLVTQTDMYIRSAQDILGRATSTLLFSAGGIVELFAETDALLEAYEGDVDVTALLDIDVESTGQTYIHSGSFMDVTAQNDVNLVGNIDKLSSDGHVLIRGTGSVNGDVTFSTPNGNVHIRADVMDTAAHTSVLFPSSSNAYNGATCGSAQLPERAFWVDTTTGEMCFCRSSVVSCI